MRLILVLLIGINSKCNFTQSDLKLSAHFFIPSFEYVGFYANFVSDVGRTISYNSFLVNLMVSIKTYLVKITIKDTIC
ncbi:hypothetical protein IWX80_002593 [Flavobacterium sp. CAN_S2]